MELQLVVKGHEADALLGSVTKVSGLLTGVGVDDALRADTEVQNGLDLVLRGGGGGEGRGGEGRGGEGRGALV